MSPTPADLRALTERAFATAPASDATAAIHRVRAELSGRLGSAYSIEVVIAEGDEPRVLRERLLADLAPILEAKGVGLADEGPVFFSVFVDDELHFLYPKDFFGGLDAVAGPVALLP